MIFINRYGDRFRFELDSDGNILWKGEFEYCRFGRPNDYTEAYNKYVTEDCDSSSMLTMGEFKTAVHEYKDGEFTDLAKKYMGYVKSNMSVIDMLDPSGGPYLAAGRDMGYIDDSFEGMKVKEFQRVDDNTWKIIIEK